MPGFTPLPSVGFNESQFAGNQTLHAEVEIRFHFLRRRAVLLCYLEVLLRTFHRPLLPA